MSCKLVYFYWIIKPDSGLNVKHGMLRNAVQIIMWNVQYVTFPIFCWNQIAMLSKCDTFKVQVLSVNHESKNCLTIT